MTLVFLPRYLEWEPSSCLSSFHHMQKHMPLKKLAPLVEPFSRHFKCRNLSNNNGRGHGAQVLHVVKNVDDAPIFCCGSREIIFLIMSVSPSLIIPIELSSLMIRF